MLGRRFVCSSMGRMLQLRASPVHMITIPSSDTADATIMALARPIVIAVVVTFVIVWILAIAGTSDPSMMVHPRFDDNGAGMVDEVRAEMNHATQPQMRALTDNSSGKVSTAEMPDDDYDNLFNSI